MAKRNRKKKVGRKQMTPSKPAAVIAQENKSEEIRQPDSEILTKSLLNVAVEYWRFGRFFHRLLMKLDAGEQERYRSQFRWCQKKIEESLTDAGMRIVNVEGQKYDPGIAATPLNIEEFESESALVVDQMLEPIIMGPEGLVRTGTVTLKKVKT